MFTRKIKQLKQEANKIKQNQFFIIANRIAGTIVLLIFISPLLFLFYNLVIQKKNLRDLGKVDKQSEQSSKVEKTPLPSSKSNYIGIWKSDPFIDSLHGGKDNHYVFLGIKKDSTIVYANHKPDLCFAFDSIITEIVNDSEIKTSIELPDWFLAGGKLKVNQSPHQAAGQWKMTIDGNELYRTKPKMEQKFRFKCSAGDLRQVSP